MTPDEIDAAAERLYYAYDQTWNKDVVEWGDERITAKRWTDMARVALGTPSDEQILEAFGDAG